MRSVTGDPAHTRQLGAPAVPGPSDGACQWCGDAAAFVWSLGGEAPADLEGSHPRAEVEVCATCQWLTLAGDDAVLLGRYTTMLATLSTYPVAVDFLREQRAAWLADWVLRRTAVRAVAEPAWGAVR